MKRFLTQIFKPVKPQPTEPVRPSPPSPSPLPSPLPAPFVNPTDGSKLVLIPGGDYTMGGGSEAHPVHVDSFYLGKYQVTNAQWKKFVDAKPEWRKDRIKREYHDGNYLKHWTGNIPPAGKENHPVVYVSWYAAVAYCEWAGLRLPTEAEWEYAAQGGKGYEYGTATGQLSKELANYYGGNEGGTTPVGKYPPNPFGIYDLSGNVWEWCSSEYRPYPYRANDGREEIRTNIDKNMNIRRVVRGGSWISLDYYLSRARHRLGLTPAFTNSDIGLRCARAPRP
jgi:formylglycine-generating enzyme required for sulfatase activity